MLLKPFPPSTRPLAVAFAGCLAASAASPSERAEHRGHTHPEVEGLRITRVTPAPPHFTGNLTYDRGAGRLWLTSFGPPANTRGPSRLYEVDPASGRVLAQRTMPFLGEFGGAAHVSGRLYQPVPHESALYRVAAGAADDLGRIVDHLRLPTFDELPPGDGDVYRFPFIAFTGAAAAADGHIVLYAADLGELVTVDRETGAVRGRVKTSKGLAGITDVPGPPDQPLLLASFDPVDSAFKQESRRFMFRATHGILPLETVRAEGNYGNPGQKTVTWVLLDPRSGEVLASTAEESTRLLVGSVAVLSREPVPGTRYGRLVALTMGEEGVMTVDWIPR